MFEETNHLLVCLLPICVCVGSRFQKDHLDQTFCSKFKNKLKQRKTL